ncbi:MAG TPA: PP2C family protein-serine/threonine phosphatase [Euzebyales bacterium]|nr:PP2C family protein-serine/threonine phosphatase [Euzebyales bacterium]
MIALTALMFALVDNTVVILPGAWLLILVGVGALLGGWRIGLVTATVGAIALWGVVMERDSAAGMPFARSVWAILQFVLAGASVSIAIGAMDRSIREMRKTARALELSEQRSAQVTQKLQAAIIPEDPPKIPELDVAARYLPADISEVGGDFYDWYQNSDACWYLEIGDVCGKGPSAASRALLARYTLRAAAMLDGDPIRMLYALNWAILAEGDDRYCTAAVLRLGLNNTVQADLALGGHPLALILRGTDVMPFGREGSLVGLFTNIELHCDRTDLLPGDRVFLYTDGITDRPAAPIEDEELHRMLAGLNHLPVDKFASELERRFLEAPDGRDDIAFVLIGVPI